MSIFFFFTFTDFQVALHFIWLQEVVLLIASANYWRGEQIDYTEMPRGMSYLSLLIFSVFIAYEL